MDRFLGAHHVLYKDFGLFADGLTERIKSDALHYSPHLQCKEFKARQGFLQARTKWHRGWDEGRVPMRFLAVLFGAKGIPNVVHLPDNR